MNNNISRQLELLNKIQSEYKDYFSEISNRYGDKDFRTNLLTKPLGSIFIQRLIILVNQSTIYNTYWWKHNKIIDSEDQSRLAEHYDMFIKKNCFVDYLNLVESEMRVMLRKLYPGACNEGRGSFESIYSKILSKLGLSNYKTTFDLARTLRNTIHNNGIHLPKSKRHVAEFHYRGSIYRFIDGEAFEFAYPDFLVELEEDILDCIRKILDQEIVKNYNSLS
ncbi:MAG: hypothetical protein IT247_05740 [Bacteroidia bacterium]|nr:hypothetical protein [Bacteroidia bacterium]